MFPNFRALPWAKIRPLALFTLCAAVVLSLGLLMMQTGAHGLHRLLAPVYAASEPPLAGGTSHDLARHFAKNGVTKLREVESLEAAWNYLCEILRDGDALLVVGAGDVEKIAFWAKEFYGEKI